MLEWNSWTYTQSSPFNAILTLFDEKHPWKWQEACRLRLLEDRPFIFATSERIWYWELFAFEYIVKFHEWIYFTAQGIQKTRRKSGLCPSLVTGSAAEKPLTLINGVTTLGAPRALQIFAILPMWLRLPLGENQGQGRSGHRPGVHWGSKSEYNTQLYSIYLMYDKDCLAVAAYIVSSKRTLPKGDKVPQAAPVRNSMWINYSFIISFP